MFLIDLTHTSHCPGHTGIQRVCRSLYRELGTRDSYTAVCFDPYENAWRRLRASERRNLRLPSTLKDIGGRGANWTTAERMRGRFRRFLPFPGGQRIGSNKKFEGILVPEIFGPGFPRALRRLERSLEGPKAALFYDAVVLKLPEHSPARTVRRFPAYLEALHVFDGIAAISESSRDDLLAYWREAGFQSNPPVSVISLAVDEISSIEGMRPSEKPLERPVVLTVATVEGRKNHCALLEGAEILWREGCDFHLRLVGALQEETGGKALREIREAESRGRPVIWLGPIGEEELAREYQRCTFTVYPSLYEGSGLSVLESLRYGKPSICCRRGALPEATRDGGCLLLDETDAQSIADGIRRLLLDDETRVRLAREAMGRSFKNWSDYAEELVAWMASLPVREASGRVGQGRVRAPCPGTIA